MYTKLLVLPIFCRRPLMAAISEREGQTPCQRVVAPIRPTNFWLRSPMTLNALIGQFAWQHNPFQWRGR